MWIRSAKLWLLGALAFGLGAQAHAAAAKCQASQLVFSVDNSRAADVDGMSHAGTGLVLRNAGAEACVLQPFVTITLANRHGALDAKAVVPGAAFLHPGPVVLPIELAPGASATATIRWVDGAVFDDSVCVDPTRVIATLDGRRMQAPLTGHVCGSKAKGITFEVSRFSLQQQAR